MAEKDVVKAFAALDDLAKPKAIPLVRKALEVYAGTLRRQLQKEVVGSAIYDLRKADIDLVDSYSRSL